MLIRTMTIDDYDRVYALWVSTPGMGLNNIDDSREGIERFLQRNPTTCFVSEDSDRIIGVILSGNDGRRGFIYHTAVAVDKRKLGIGTLLVQAALAAQREAGISKVALVVFKRNEIGNDFWAELGFNVRGDLNYRNLALLDLTRIDT